MDSFLTCPRCNASFDTNEFNPRILPCNQLICFKCIEATKQVLGGYSIECDCSQRVHSIDKLDDLTPSQLSLYYLNKPTGVESSFDLLNNLKHLLDEYKYKLELTKYDINKHYDDMEMDIDIRAETLINFIHESRDMLHTEIKAHREETIQNIDSYQEEFSKELTSLEKKHTTSNLDEFITQFNKSQKRVDDLKGKAWYFVENTSILDKSLLGYNLSTDFDKNYLKIKHINSLLLNDLKRFEITLKPKFKDEKLRQYIVPISRQKLLSCYFTISKCIYLELFDHNGESLKLEQVADHVTYFPIVLCCNDLIVLSYISKVKVRSLDIFAESTVSYINLFDSNLNLIKTISDKSLIESIYINESRIICSFAHKTFDCCRVYDLHLNLVETFGQQNDKDKPFFLEKSHLNNKQLHNTKEKLNPIMFGFTDKNIYFYNSKSMFVMSRKLGLIVKEMNKINDKSYFILDSQMNVIEINTHSNKLKLVNFEYDISVEASYDLNFDDAFLVEEKYFVFVDKNKESLTIV